MNVLWRRSILRRQFHIITSSVARAAQGARRAQSGQSNIGEEHAALNLTAGGDFEVVGYGGSREVEVLHALLLLRFLEEDVDQLVLAVFCFLTDVDVVELVRLIGV